MGGVDVTRRIRGAGPQMIVAVLDHALHANTTLVDRVDLATWLSLPSLDQLPASRLLPPRSGLSRSDFVLGSIASLWLPVGPFRFAPNSGHGAAPQ